MNRISVIHFQFRAYYILRSFVEKNKMRTIFENTITYSTKKIFEKYIRP